MRKYIQYIQLEPLFVQQQILMLRMDIHQLLAQFFHLRQRCRRVVNESTALSRGIQLTTQDALSVILQFLLVKERAHAIRRNIKMRFNNALGSIGPNGPYISTLPQQQAYSS